MGRTTRPAKRTSQSVDKALALLWAFDGSREDMGVVELGRIVGLTPSNVSRLLSSLVHGNVVQYNEVTGRYRLGVGLMRLASLVSARLDLRSVARPHLTALAVATSETSSISIFADGQAFTIDFVPSPLPVVSTIQLGRPGLVHCTAVGKLLLAHAGEATRTGALSAELPRFTPNTIVDPDLLRAELKRILDVGYAVAEEEREAELNAVAVPVHGTRGEVVAALGVQGPAHRFDRDSMFRALPLLCHQAESLSRELGAPPRSRM